MTDQWHGGQSGPGERWNVNLPAVVGVVFVFLVGVVIWVIATSGGDDEQASATTQSSAPPSTPTTGSVPTAVTTSPPPMPATTPAPGTTLAPVASTLPAATAPPPTPAPTPTVPDTEAPTDTDVAPPTEPPESGDLGVPGHPIQRPPCDGAYITILGSAIGGQATADGMKGVLDDYSGAHYLRTDVTCPSLTPSQNGQPIYVIYLGPFVVDSDACQARAQGPSGAYVRQLSNSLTPDHRVSCS